GQFEIAVVVEDGVEGDRRPGGSLEMGQVFETAAGARGEFLRGGKMLAAMSQRLGLLLQQAEFLQMVRRKADQVALAGHSDLKRLPNPPSGVGGEARAVADIKAIDGLHQSANGFLKKVGVAERVMAEALGNVSGKTNVGRGESVLQMDV